LILFSSPLELEIKKIKIMNNFIIDATSKKIFLTLILDKNVYICSHENSKNNFEKLIVLINEFLDKNKSSFNMINNIYVNRGPGSFAGIRNSLSIVKGLFLTKKIDYYCFSFEDFNKLDNIQYKDIPDLCTKFKIKKNLIKPVYLS
jgi:tRNA A37 threonylcarbamoyladenosine modification protein TsaB|tara:strand:- start:200 stop:637 length:438 start_codon:yes stop_codon:yes gene_type:complete